MFVDKEKQREVKKALSLEIVRKKLDELDFYKAVVETRRGEAMKYHLYEYSYINDTRTVILLTSSDITDAMNKERENQRRIEAALIKAEEASEAKSQFFSNMSHDIRTPLNAILNLTALMRKELDQPKALAVDLDKIQMSSTYLLELVNEVLDMTKIESGKMELNPEVYTYDEFIEYLDSVISPMCMQKGITFHLDRGQSFKDIYVDKVRFNQIFMNLVSNAVKYTDRGGSVVLQVTNAVVKDNTLTCDFIIRDNGRGMSEEFKNRMFLPFEQEEVTNAYSGTGLGLTITKSIIEKIGGSIRIESSQGIGTTVIVRLSTPLATPQQREEYKRKHFENKDEETEVKHWDKRVLVVEDNELNQEIVQRILEDVGIEVEAALDGQKAVDMFAKSNVDYYHAILMDVRMPVMDGYEATEIIRSMERADARSIPIIAMTAEAFEGDMRKAHEIGMNEHLAKPVNPERLYKTLRYWLR